MSCESDGVLVMTTRAMRVGSVVAAGFGARDQKLSRNWLITGWKPVPHRFWDGFQQKRGGWRSIVRLKRAGKSARRDREDKQCSNVS